MRTEQRRSSSHGAGALQGGGEQLGGQGQVSWFRWARPFHRLPLRGRRRGATRRVGLEQLLGAIEDGPAIAV